MLSFELYNLETYKNDIDKFGLSFVWNEIIQFSLHNINHSVDILQSNNFGELYEIGLAHSNKKAKKEDGRYYTPYDVANLISSWAKDLQGENVCDVCCGTGNLILSYLEVIGEKKAKKLLMDGYVYLYDVDTLALDMCKCLIALKYGNECAKNVHYCSSDFLSAKVKLPKNSKVIANPPYSKIKQIDDDIEQTDVLKESKELYCAIMEKILTQSRSSVIITPHSFLCGKKFSSLRQVMNNYSGFIISFDNVPGNIFNGKKHGTFNTNKTNAVRAAITITREEENKGYRVSPLIRFKNEERTKLLNKEVLESTLTEKYQMPAKNNCYYKCFANLEKCFEKWEKVSSQKLNDLVSCNISPYMVCIPNSCRYFTVASQKDLKRTGKYYLYFEDKETKDLVYCYINSSFAYWHWRLYDGGINYSKSLLLQIPVFFNVLTNTQKEKLLSLAKEMQSKEKEFLVYKKNANEMQENLKFPPIYRQQINEILCESLGIESTLLEVIHKNSFFNN